MKWMLLLLAAWAAPAWADTTADYRAADGTVMHFEVSSGGDVRYSMSGPGNTRPIYAVIHGGKVYNIVDGIAYQPDEYAAVVGELMGLRSGPAAALLAEQPKIEIVEQGTETVRGRTGRAFYMRMLSTGETASWSAFVMSDDKDLAELGNALARLYQLASGLTGAQFGGGAFFGLARQVMAKGAPIRLLRNFELDTVGHTPIPVERFAIPAKTGTREELRAWFAARMH